MTLFLHPELAREVSSAVSDFESWLMQISIRNKEPYLSVLKSSLCSALMVYAGGGERKKVHLDSLILREENLPAAALRPPQASKRALRARFALSASVNSTGKSYALCRDTVRPQLRRGGTLHHAAEGCPEWI
jgi:hypothetical protein